MEVHILFTAWNYHDFVNDKHSRSEVSGVVCPQMSCVHIMGHMTFVSLQFSRELVSWI